MQSFLYLLVCQHYFHRIKYISQHTLMMSRQLNMTHKKDIENATDFPLTKNLQDLANLILSKMP